MSMSHFLRSGVHTSRAGTREPRRRSGRVAPARGLLRPGWRDDPRTRAMPEIAAAAADGSLVGRAVAVGAMHVRSPDRRFIARDRLTGRMGVVERLFHTAGDPEPMAHVLLGGDVGNGGPRREWFWLSELEGGA